MKGKIAHTFDMNHDRRIYVKIGGNLEAWKTCCLERRAIAPDYVAMDYFLHATTERRIDQSSVIA